MASIFNFITKEGKHFTSIVNNKTRYKFAGAGQGDDGGDFTSFLRPETGIKGVFAKVRIELTDAARPNKAELFAVNTETFQSSQ